MLKYFYIMGHDRSLFAITGDEYMTKQQQYHEYFYRIPWRIS